MDGSELNVNTLSVMLDDSLNTSNNVSLVSHKHPRLDAYKRCAQLSNQEERRKTLLNDQKKKRESLTNLKRNIESIVGQKSLSKKSNQEHGKYYQRSALYNNQLMFSEWLEEEPADFYQDWIMVVCPVGKRCLVVAMSGVTTAYTKAGKQICQHSSKLPGGNKDSRSDFQTKDYTILDCIFNYELQTYFVLDVLVYKSHPVVDSETEFRFFWLKCKLNENIDVERSCYGNPYKFLDLPRVFTTGSESIRNFLLKPFEFETDGILFYHKEVHYTAGHTPLVVWLKHYMLPEILCIQIPDWIQARIPSDYKGYKETIQRSNTEQQKIVQLLKLKENKMEEDFIESDNKASLNSEMSSTDDENYQLSKTACLSQPNDFCIRHFSDFTESSSQSSHKESSGEN